MQFGDFHTWDVTGCLTTPSPPPTLNCSYSAAPPWDCPPATDLLPDSAESPTRPLLHRDGELHGSIGWRGEEGFCKGEEIDGSGGAGMGKGGVENVPSAKLPAHIRKLKIRTPILGI